jgi:hypothetical protein
MRTNFSSETIIFSGDTSVIICSENFYTICAVSNLVLSHISKRFAASKLVLNLDEMTVIKFIRNSSLHCALNIGYKAKYVEQIGKYKIPWFTN